MELTDSQLLIRYHTRRDEAAFAILVERHRAWIYASARRRLRDDHHAEDAAQAVFIVLAEKAAQLITSNRASLSAWLFHVMHFACTRIKRAQTRQLAVWAASADTLNPAGQEIVDADLLTLLEESICDLPTTDRDLIVRRFYRAESFVQIGDSLGISADAVRKRVGRALQDIQAVMLRDGSETVPETFLENIARSSADSASTNNAVAHHARINHIVKGTNTMIEEQKALEFSVVSAEFFVSDVEANIAFFEKLGFRRRYVEAMDAMGRIPRASLVAGVGRIWLRRTDASEGTHPTPGITLYFWIEGGVDGLIAHRKRIADEGVAVSSFRDDISLRNFTVETPDGYRIGFFVQYR